MSSGQNTHQPHHLTDPIINFGYRPTEATSNEAVKSQLIDLTRRLVHSPDYTIDAYNQYFDEADKIKEPVGEQDEYIRNKAQVLFHDRENHPNGSPSSIQTHSDAASPRKPRMEVSSEGFSTQLQQLLSHPIQLALPLLEEQNTLIIKEGDTIGRFLDMLHRNSLRSCIVQHRRARWLRQWTSSYSFVDVRDFLCHVVRMHQQWRNKSFFEILEIVKKEKVGKIANISKRSPFIRHDTSDKIEYLCAAFKPCCRVPIFDKERLVRVISPADLLYILNSYDVVCEIERATGVSIKLAAKRRILKLKESESLLKAMILMERHGYSAIPIVSEKDPNKVLSVITVREIKYLSLDQNELYSEAMLNEPAIKFVSFLRRTGRLRHEAFALLPATACLRDMINVFLGSAFENTQSVHRIFLIDENNKMAGMVSLTNVMQNIADLLGQFYKVPRKGQLPHSHPAHNRS